MLSSTVIVCRMGNLLSGGDIKLWFPTDTSFCLLARIVVMLVIIKLLHSLDFCGFAVVWEPYDKPPVMGLPTVFLLTEDIPEIGEVTGLNIVTMHGNFQASRLSIRSLSLCLDVASSVSSESTSVQTIGTICTRQKISMPISDTHWNPASGNSEALAFRFGRRSSFLTERHRW